MKKNGDLNDIVTEQCDFGFIIYVADLVLLTMFLTVIKYHFP